MRKSKSSQDFRPTPRQHCKGDKESLGSFDAWLGGMEGPAPSTARQTAKKNKNENLCVSVQNSFLHYIQKMQTTQMSNHGRMDETKVEYAYYWHKKERDPDTHYTMDET